MAKTIVEQVMAAHLVSGELTPGAEVALKIDHTLTQDATGTLAYLEFEAMGVERVRPEVAVSYVDHNLPQTDFRNADDHRFLRTVAAKYGLYFSPPGNGISHQVHLERFSAPGKTLLGSDSHTPTAGGAGMLAFGAGGLDVALALAGQPFYLVVPEILGVRLTGRFRPWVSAKDVILELLRRLTVKGGRGKILEFFGPALRHLSVPQRAAITNMGAELGATTSIFPADAQTRKFLKMQGREQDFRPLTPQGRPRYAAVEEVDLGALTPLTAQPSSPDRVAPVKELEGTPVEQVLIGSCANSSFRDLMIAARALQGRRVHPRVSLEINPGSRQVLENLILAGGLVPLLEAGARVMPPGCWGCIGMGQAPPTNAASVRTFPRNFPGRSGTKDDRVYLASPETAVAAAIFGALRDPRDLGDYPRVSAAPACGGQRQQHHTPAAAGRGRGSGPGAQHRALSPADAPARDLARRSVAQSGGQCHHRRHPAGGQPDPAAPEQPPGHQPVRLHPSGPGISPAGSGPGGRRGGGRGELRPGVVPGARRPGAPVPGGEGQTGEKLCPDSPGQPDQFRHPAPDLRESRGLRPLEPGPNPGIARGAAAAAGWGGTPAPEGGREGNLGPGGPVDAAAPAAGGGRGVEPGPERDKVP